MPPCFLFACLSFCCVGGGGDGIRILTLIRGNYRTLHLELLIYNSVLWKINWSAIWFKLNDWIPSNLLASSRMTIIPTFGIASDGIALADCEKKEASVYVLFLPFVYVIWFTHTNAIIINKPLDYQFIWPISFKIIEDVYGKQKGASNALYFVYKWFPSLFTNIGGTNSPWEISKNTNEQKWKQRSRCHSVAMSTLMII